MAMVYQGANASASSVSRLLRCGEDLRQLPEVLGGGGEEEFVVGAARAA